MYEERLSPPAWSWAVVALLAVSFAIVLLPVSQQAAAVALVLSAVGLSVGLRRTAALVQVRDGVLAAGAARIPVTLLGEVRELDRVAMRHERGPGLDARAFLCIRGWVDTGVRVELVDPRDPTPYWLLSTREPAALAAALRQAAAAGLS